MFFFPLVGLEEKIM